MKHFLVLVLVTVILTAVSTASYEIDVETCNACVQQSTETMNGISPQADHQSIHAKLTKLCDLFAKTETKHRVCTGAVDDVTSLWAVEDDNEDWLHVNYSPRSICSTLSLCQVPCCLTLQRPEQVHISHMADPANVVVMWVTYELAKKPVVEIAQGPIPDSATQKKAEYQEIQASSHTYTEGGWCGQIYQANVTGLKPNTVYHYRVGDKNVSHHPRSAWSDFFSFRSAPAPNPDSPADEYTVLAFGDWGASEYAQLVLRPIATLALNNKIDFAVHVGDLSYANGDQAVWDAWMRMTEPVQANVLYNPVAGNHESYESFAAFLNRYPVPGANRTKKGARMYYSFDYGNIHFVAFTLEQRDTLLPGGEQRKFLEEDLAAANANRATVPWVIAMGHRPLYCMTNSSRCTSDAEEFRLLLENIFYENNVDLVLTGHNHNYERTYPVYQNKIDKRASDPYVDPKYPVYVIVGTGGRALTDNWIAEPPVWSAVHDTVLGYSLLRTDGSKGLYFEFWNERDVMLDSFNITRTK